MRKPSEDNLQKACFLWFSVQYPELKGSLFHVPNGGSRHKAEAVKFKKMGLVAGISDFIFCHNGKTTFIELKTEEFTKTGKKKISKQQPSQVAFQDYITRQGFEYYIITNVDQFVRLIRHLLKI